MPDPVVPQQPVPPPAPPVPPPIPPAPPQKPAPKLTLQGGIAAAIALIILVAILWALYQKGGFFLNSLQEIPVARGLITFLIAITTMCIAIMLAYSTLFGEAAPDDDKTFDRGKQVLSVLIGLLGTIVGFYFRDACQWRANQASRTDNCARPRQQFAAKERRDVYDLRLCPRWKTTLRLFNYV